MVAKLWRLGWAVAVCEPAVDVVVARGLLMLGLAVQTVGLRAWGIQCL